MLFSLINSILEIYKWAVIVWMIIRSLSQFGILNEQSEIVKKLEKNLDKIINPVLDKIRHFIPSRLGNLDLASLILFIIIGVLQSFIGNK